MSAVVEQLVLEDVWHGLYGESWKGLICDEAFAHPAKFSRALIRRIYDHVMQEGWANKADSVVDPFGGVALGSFDAMRHGLNWYGCELEEKFVGLGSQNIALWNDRFSRMPSWGTARLLQGDSRKLVDAMSAAACCVSSPPYAGNEKSDYLMSDDGKTRRRDEKRGFRQGHGCFRGSEGAYGSSEGQLGAMKEGDLNLAISSPPYVNAMNCERNGIEWDKIKPDYDGRIQTAERQAANNRRHTELKYGTTEGQLGAMPEGQLCVTSPPYENAVSSGRDGIDFAKAGRPDKMLSEGYKKNYPIGAGAECDYAYNKENEHNLGNQRGETFWSASRLILEQLHQVIVPGGHAVFVLKAFVRDKKIVDFPGQWAQLCEAVGFRLLHHHRASLVEHSGTQGGFDRDKEIRVERKSFFRRLAEAKGSPRIDHESVLCFERA
jgi:hypothetical protein